MTSNGGSKEIMNREEALAVLRELAKRLGHPPSFGELEDQTTLRTRHIRRFFGNYTRALRECGLGSRANTGLRIPMELLFEDWATVVRKLKKIPSITEYQARSKYTWHPFHRRFGRWSRVPEAMREHAREHGLENAWRDVLELIRESGEKRLAGKTAGRSASALRAPVFMKDRPVYGPSMAPGPLAHEPINEAGVLFLFGAMAASLGFIVTLVQDGFPDCEALREVAPRRLQRVRIELEHESRNFLKHGHAIDGCDMIVCWIHNWPECPLEVLELRSVIG